MKRALAVLLVVLAWSTAAAAQQRSYSLGDRLDVVVTDDEAATLRDGGHPLRLYLDSLLVHGSEGYWDTTDPDTLHFALRRTAASRADWAELLGGRFLESRTVSVAVGIEGSTAPPLALSSATLRTLPDGSTLILIITLALLLGCAVLVVLHPSILRDGAPPSEGGHRTFSLGRVQMAIWTLQIVLAYVAIYAVTGAFDALTASVLALMGISSGTTLGAALIDASKTVLSDAERQRLLARADALQSLVALEEVRLAVAAADAVRAHALLATTPQDPAVVRAVAANDGDVRVLRERLASLRTEREENERARAVAPAAWITPSRGFWHDILNDGDGASIHRVQMILWTVVMSVLFWRAVWLHLEMPDFDATLLALMGISAGTYLGFKFPERP